MLNDEKNTDRNFQKFKIILKNLLIFFWKKLIIITYTGIYKRDEQIRLSSQHLRLIPNIFIDIERILFKTMMILEE